MLHFLKKIFTGAPAEDFAMLVQDGAQIIDVRSPDEFKSGHIQKSVNIPLPVLQNQLSKIKKNKAVITCCASGMRSGVAKSILKKRTDLLCITVADGILCKNTSTANNEKY